MIIVTIIWCVQNDIICCVQTGLSVISEWKRFFDDNSWRKFTDARAVTAAMKNAQLSSTVNHGHAYTFQVLLVLLAYE